MTDLTLPEAVFSVLALCSVVFFGLMAVAYFFVGDGASPSFLIGAPQGVASYLYGASA